MGADEAWQLVHSLIAEPPTFDDTHDSAPIARRDEVETGSQRKSHGRAVQNVFDEL